MKESLFLIAVLNSITLLAFSRYIGHNPRLPSRNKKYLITSVCLLAASILLEAFALLVDGKSESITGYYVLLIADIFASSWVVPTQIFGLGFEKEGKIAAAFTVFYCVLVIAALPQKLIFYISDEGVYRLGRFSWIMLLWVLLTSAMLLIILIGLARRFRKSDTMNLVIIGLLEVTGYVFSLISQYDIVQSMHFSLTYMLTYYYYVSLSDQQMYDELKDSMKRNDELSLQMVRVMVNALDARDSYTSGHSHRVAEYSVLLAKKLGWNEEEIRKIEYEGLLHDVGKIGLPDSVLNKPGRLSNAEFNIIKSHTLFGSDILEELEGMPEVQRAARWHHERYDGRGYPDGKTYREIPDSVRIISLADSFDAMNSDRIYRHALPKDVILSELEKGKGSQFDPELADLLIELFKNGETDEIAASGKHASETHVDEYIEELRDFFEMFHVNREAREGWAESNAQTERMRKYLVGMAKRYETNVEIALINVVPKEGTVLPDGELESAVNVMIQAASSTVKGLIAGSQISKTQIVVIRKWEEGPALAQFLQLAVVYYYKVFKADGLEVSYSVLKNEET